LTKLFKGQKGGPPGSAPGQQVPVAASFNEQLMNQTNFGYNPARNTLASGSGQGAHGKDVISFDSFNG